MHLVSCRHNTSGRAALMNLATRSMRSRTELMFQVVRERRMGTSVLAYPRRQDTIVHSGRRCVGWVSRRRNPPRPATKMVGYASLTHPTTRYGLARRGLVVGEVDL